MVFISQAVSLPGRKQNQNFTTMSFFEMHTIGGLQFMLVLTLILFAIFALVLYALLAIVQKKPIHPNWVEAIKQLGGLAAAWGAWSTLIGFFYALGALEAAKDDIPFNMICGGLKVALITVLYGLSIFCFSLLSYLVIRLMKRTTNA
jgi:flagellar motor component MotA